jgi:hypothetical protein
MYTVIHYQHCLYDRAMMSDDLAGDRYALFQFLLHAPIRLLY